MTAAGRQPHRRSFHHSWTSLLLLPGTHNREIVPCLRLFSSEGGLSVPVRFIGETGKADPFLVWWHQSTAEATLLGWSLRSGWPPLVRGGPSGTTLPSASLQPAEAVGVLCKNSLNGNNPNRKNCSGKSFWRQGFLGARVSGGKSFWGQGFLAARGARKAADFWLIHGVADGFRGRKSAGALLTPLSGRCYKQSLWSWAICLSDSTRET